MATKAKTLTPAKAERVIMLASGEPGTGKSFLVACLRNARIYDSDIGGGLAYLDARIAANGSERIEVASYTDIIDDLKKNRAKMQNVSTLAIDQLTSLQQEAVLRYNPTFADDTFGKEHDRATKEWQKIRELVRYGGYNLVCTAHLKSKWQKVNGKSENVGLTTDGPKNVEADFNVVLYLERTEQYPSTAHVKVKWRRDPDDSRGPIPNSFPFTMEEFVRLHGFPLEGKREEVPMASPEQVATIKRLVDVVKVPEGEVQKWMTKAKADAWEDFTSDALGKCIAFLNERLQGKSPG